MKKAKPPKQKIVKAWGHADQLLMTWQEDIRPYLQTQHPNDDGIPIMDDAIHHAYRVMRDLRNQIEGVTT